MFFYVLYALYLHQAFLSLIFCQVQRKRSSEKREKYKKKSMKREAFLSLEILFSLARANLFPGNATKIMPPRKTLCWPLHFNILLRPHLQFFSPQSVS